MIHHVVRQQLEFDHIQLNHLYTEFVKEVFDPQKLKKNKKKKPRSGGKISRQNGKQRKKF